MAAKTKEALSLFNEGNQLYNTGQSDEALNKYEKALKQELISAENQLTGLRNQRDEAYGTGWTYITRMRAGIKGIYGDDSSEYEMAGGTRRSERKPRSRRAKVQSA